MERLVGLWMDKWKINLWTQCGIKLKFLQRQKVLIELDLGNYAANLCSVAFIPRFLNSSVTPRLNREDRKQISTEIFQFNFCQTVYTLERLI